MAIKSLEQRKRQQILLFVTFGILLATFLILYFGFFKKESAPEEATPISQTGPATGQSVATEEKLKKINLDFEFLNEKILSFLKIHGDLPVEKGTTGRENPYLPF